MRIFLAVVVLVFGLQAKNLFSNKDQEEASKYIDALKDLVIATQKTRGKTNAYLNGDKSALLLIQGTKRDMKRAIGEMESLPLSNNPTISERETAISQALTELNAKALRSKNPKAIFAAYTEQIEQLLMLAQSVSKQGSKDLNPLGKEATQIMMETILPLAEYIGRLRGKGSGIVAKGTVTETQKFAMTSLMNEVDNLESRLQSEMRVMLSKYGSTYDKSATNRYLSKLHKQVKAYMDTVNTKVLANKKVDPSCNSAKFFDQGTDIISTLMLVFNANRKAIVKDSQGWI